MASMLIAWDEDGAVLARLSFLARRDKDGEVVGHYDFEALEADGHRLRDLWDVPGAVGSGAWPEFLGAEVHDFRVERRGGERGGEPLIRALVHRRSGHRRERADIEARLLAHVRSVSAAARAKGVPAAVDVTEVLGGPGQRALRLDADGRTQERFRAVLPDLPFLRTADAADAASVAVGGPSRREAAGMAELEARMRAGVPAQDDASASSSAAASDSAAEMSLEAGAPSSEATASPRRQRSR